MSRAFLSALALIAPLSLAALSGCGGSDDPAPTTTADTGTTPVDTGTPPVDTGTPTDTGGTPTDTGGTPTDTGGTPTDTGAPSEAGGSKTHAVEVSGFSFTPASLTIKAGDSVEWTWKGGTHTVTQGTGCVAGGGFSSGAAKSSGTFTFKFEKAGTFDYFCEPHCSGGMKAKIIVE